MKKRNLLRIFPKDMLYKRKTSAFSEINKLTLSKHKIFSLKKKIHFRFENFPKVEILLPNVIFE